MTDSALTPAPGDPKTARKISRLWPVVSGAVTLLLVAGGGLLLAGRQSSLSIDAEWMEELVEHRNAIWDVPSLAMNFLGGGWFGVIVVPLLIVGVLCLFRRFWSALYFALAAALSAGLVQLLKNLFDRERPLDQIIASDFGSFPSGHVANAATTAVALGIVFWRTWVWIAGTLYTVLMLLSRTYLGAHWLTDTLGGLLLGAAVAVILWAPLAARIQAERAKRAGAGIAA